MCFSNDNLEEKQSTTSVIVIYILSVYLIREVLMSRHYNYRM